MQLVSKPPLTLGFVLYSKAKHHQESNMVFLIECSCRVAGVNQWSREEKGSWVQDSASTRRVGLDLPARSRRQRSANTELALPTSTTPGA